MRQTSARARFPRSLWCALVLWPSCVGFSVDKVDGLDVDADGDGYIGIVDCDDTNADIHPSGVEVCDGLDNDCDGIVDGDPQSGSDGRPPYWPDGDLDGFGDVSAMVTYTCEPSASYVDNGDDCNDADGLSYPDAEEFCDNKDNDCDGAVDEDAVDATVFYIDNDRDGFGDADSFLRQCTRPEGDFWSVEPGDCNDGDPDQSPDVEEVCGDGIDNNCDGTEDEGCP